MRKSNPAAPMPGREKSNFFEMLRDRIATNPCFDHEGQAGFMTSRKRPDQPDKDPGLANSHAFHAWRHRY